jgi:hypothetical protein
MDAPAISAPTVDRSRDHPLDTLAANRGWIPLAAAAAVAAAAILGYLLIVDPSLVRFGDFDGEAWAPYQVLAHGHLVAFIQTGPAYVVSLLLRAPVALIPSLWGGGSRAVFYASTIPCLLVAAGFGAWLATVPRTGLPAGLTRGLGPLLAILFNPIAWDAIISGHPEDLVIASLCTAGVVLAADGRAAWGGFLVAFAADQKAWALVAVPVALAAMPRGHRRALVVTALTLVVAFVPLALIRAHGLAPGAVGTSFGGSTSSIFLWPQLLWWFGPHAWISRMAHPMIVVVATATAGLWWLRHRPARTPAALGRRAPDALLLLALVFLLRAALDPWDSLYYHVPFVFALTAQQVFAGRRLRVAIVCTAVLLLIVPTGWIDLHWGGLAVIYAAGVVPMLAYLVFRALGTDQPAAAVRQAA